MSDKPELTIDSYPWAAPTDEQKLMFDALSYEEQLKMLQDALIEGEKSGDDGVLNMEEILHEAKKKSGLL